MVALNKQYTSPNTIGSVQFDLDAELSKHAWRPNMDYDSAEDVLKGKSAYTYLLRRSMQRGKFEISFIRPDGGIYHDQFTLINPKMGIWRNGHYSHIGNLHKVIRDMMDCAMHEGQPLE